MAMAIVMAVMAMTGIAVIIVTGIVPITRIGVATGTGIVVGNGSAYAVAVVFVLAMVLIGYGTFSEVPLAILIGAVLGVGSILTVLYVYSHFN